ncbi:MAG: hypothetical protein KF862_06995 [Chitinophagaceae bacterium]|nr:hypothetical protein [Chitinophagaceae bacterium]
MRYHGLFRALSWRRYRKTLVNLACYNTALFFHGIYGHAHFIAMSLNEV